MHAITMKDKTACIDYVRCIGCGVCVSKCSVSAISLRERKNYSPPAKTLVDHAVNRYLEIKKKDKAAPLSRMSLGVGRLLSGLVQPYVSGPRYKRK